MMTGLIIRVSPHIGHSWKKRGVWEFTEKETIFCTILIIKHYNITFYL